MYCVAGTPVTGIPPELPELRIGVSRIGMEQKMWWFGLAIAALLSATTAVAGELEFSGIGRHTIAQQSPEIACPRKPIKPGLFDCKLTRHSFSGILIVDSMVTVDEGTGKVTSIVVDFLVSKFARATEALKSKYGTPREETGDFVIWTPLDHDSTITLIRSNDRAFFLILYGDDSLNPAVDF